MIRQLRFVPLLVIGFALPGCGSDGPPQPERYPVSGTVTLDGKPLETGTIYFKTVATGGIDGMEIHGGQFSGDAEAGERRVEISSMRTIIADMGGMQSEAQVNDIPPRYNSESNVTVNVTPEGPNDFTFEVTSK